MGYCYVVMRGSTKLLSRCCRAPVSMETIGGMLLFHTHGTQKRYGTECSKCLRRSYVLKPPTESLTVWTPAVARGAA